MKKKILITLISLIAITVSFFYGYLFFIEQILSKTNIVNVESEYLQIFQISKVVLCEITAFFSTAIVFIFALYRKEMREKKFLYINSEILECEK